MSNLFESSCSSKYRGDGTHPAYPIGFKFCPNKQVIVKEFLMKRSLNQLMADNPIKEMNVYLYNPQDLPNMDEANICRTTPDGYWKLVESDEPIKDEHSKEIIAFKNSFIYYTNEAAANGRYKTNWTMEEFRLNDGENLEGPKMKYRVLCKIRIKIPPVYASKKASSKKKGRHNNVTSSRNVTDTSREETSPIHLGERVDPASIQSYDSKEKENRFEEETKEGIKAKADVIKKEKSKKNIAVEGNGNRKALKLLR